MKTRTATLLTTILLAAAGLSSQAQILPAPTTNTLHVQMVGYTTNQFGTFTSMDPNNNFTFQVVFYADGTLVEIADTYSGGFANTNFVAEEWNNDIGYAWFAHCYWNRNSNCVTTITNIWYQDDPFYFYLTNAPGITSIGLNGSTNISTLTNLPVQVNCNVEGPPITVFYEVKAPTNLDAGAMLNWSYILTTNKWHTEANYGGQYYGSSALWGEDLGPNFWRTSNSVHDPAWRVRFYQSGHYIQTNKSANW